MLPVGSRASRIESLSVALSFSGRSRVGVFTAGFTGAAREVLVAFHVQNGAEVRERGLALDLQVPHFKDLQWRLDVQVRGLV